MLTQEFPLVGSLAKRIIAGINRLSSNIGVGSMGEYPAPPPVDSTSVKGAYNSTTNILTAPGELLHFVHTHNAQINRGIQYVTEIDTNPNFPQPHPIDTGASRSGFVTLPTFLDDGMTKQTYYLRVTAQYHGSAPSKVTVYGGPQSPIGIQMSGTTAATLLTSQQAGTARPGQGGTGIGPVQTRPQVGGPKRILQQ